MKRSLSETRFEELKDRNFELVRVVEMLCEVCKKPLSGREKPLKTIQILNLDDYQNLLNKARVHDRAEVDFENGRIYFYDHDFPGDIHPECIGKL